MGGEGSAMAPLGPLLGSAALMLCVHRAAAEPVIIIMNARRLICATKQHIRGVREIAAWDRVARCEALESAFATLHSRAELRLLSARSERLSNTTATCYHILWVFV